MSISKKCPEPRFNGFGGFEKFYFDRRETKIERLVFRKVEQKIEN
jgi:hypothetical protein